jgi:predicted outer membrane repeat protein
VGRHRPDGDRGPQEAPVLILLPLASQAATVDVCATCTYTTVGDAVAAASPGDTINVAAGTYDETDLVIDFDLTLVGAGSDVTTLRSASAQVLYLGTSSPTATWPVIDVSGLDLEPTAGRGAYVKWATATLTDIRVDDLTGNDSGLGVAIKDADVTLVDSVFEDLVTTADGAAVHRVGYGGLSLEGCSFARNYATTCGAVYGGATASGCTFENNAASAHGGAICGAVSTDCTFTDNTAGADGGAVYGGGGSTNDVFVGNSASGYGGAIAEGTTVTGSSFSSNSAAYGGAFGSHDASWGWSPELLNVTLEGNQASIAGGDVFVDSGSATLTDTSISGSSAPSGGSVYVGEGSLTLLRVSATGITAGDHAFGSVFHGALSVAESSFEDIDGDGIYAVTSVLDVRGSSFANISGAAVFADDTATTIDSCAFERNGSGFQFGWGMPTVVRISNSTFSGHTSSAIRAADTKLEVEGCVFASNASTGSGGAISAIPVYELALIDNVFSGNSGTAGGAVYAHSYDTSIVGNRFCGNTAETGGAVAYHSMSSGTGGSDWTGNLWSGNTATTAGGDLYLTHPAALVNNTFVDSYAPTGGSVWSDADLDFRNNIVAYTSEYALYGEGGTATISYNDFWEVSPDAVGGTWPAADSTNLSVDPMWVSYVEGGCEELDLGLLPDSPLWDAGDPSTGDSDGTRADIGATGGSVPAEGTRRWYLDADGDGYGVLDAVTYAATVPAGYASNVSDCDDSDADRFPGNPEQCDGRDEDCDGIADEEPIDETLWATDADGDGFQGTTVVKGCEGPDGWVPRSGEADCDDADPTAHPGGVEICDGIDQDCDGDIDEELLRHYRPDLDSDGFQALDEAWECEAPEGWSEAGDGPFDCDDQAADVHPGASEIPDDGIDQDCDGGDAEGPGPADTDVAREASGGACKGCTSAVPYPGWALVLAFAALRTRRSGRSRRGDRR